ncbi:MAG: hypothetical protein Kow0080_36950 [Candidatus Promineifilaceae bacterium]
MMWMGQHMYGLGWSGWLLGGLMMLLFWGGLIAVIFFIARAFSGNGRSSQQSPASSSQSALDILKQRYARGEISKEEFEQIRQDLES